MAKETIEGDVAYLLEERRNGWCFQFPPETGLWRGPFTTEGAAKDAAKEVVAELVADQVRQMLGLK